MEKIMVYIDGFNLYFGMMAGGYKEYKWLDVRALSDNLLKDGQQLIAVKYFTARVKNNASKAKRQSTYLDALSASGVELIFGLYQNVEASCPICGQTYLESNEKMTDVNIASHLIADAYEDKFDGAMLISGDSDLNPPIRVINENFKRKRVFVAFPPKRHNQTVANNAKGSFIIGRKKLKESQLPDTIDYNGFTLRKPNEWT